MQRATTITEDVRSVTSDLSPEHRREIKHGLLLLATAFAQNALSNGHLPTAERYHQMSTQLSRMEQAVRP